MCTRDTGCKCVKGILDMCARDTGLKCVQGILDISESWGYWT